MPRVMGILNVTPDSFSDGGCYLAPEAAVAQARLMVEEGAAVIDVGGESTRPGAAPVAEEEELRRVVPVIEALAVEIPSTVICIDTRKASVMRAAVAAGAGMINDVSALRHDGALAAAVELQVPVCLMHMQGEPRSMQAAPLYQDVVSEVKAFLAKRALLCERAGLSRTRLLVDPGFGFGKNMDHNLQLLRELARFADLNLPLVVGLSRKSMIGTLLDVPVGQRLYGSIALAALAVCQGARLIRAHDVAATVQAVKMAAAVTAAGPWGPRGSA